MGHPLRIYGDGAQVSLYDATNGVYHCGFTGEEILVEETLFQAGLSDSNKVKINKAATFEIPLLQTDTTVLDELESRRGILQEVYIIGLESAVKIRDVFIQAKLERDFKPGGIHKITLTGMRSIQVVAAAASLPETNYVQFIQNILGARGNCDVDGGSGIAEGWENNGGTSLSVAASHLGGGYTNEQRLTLADATKTFLMRVRFPLNALAIKITASAYVDNTKTGISYYKFGFRTITEGLAVVSNVEEKTLAESANERISYTLTVIPTASLFIDVIFTGSAEGTAELGFDNVQLEIGSLTNYVENA